MKLDVRLEMTRFFLDRQEVLDRIGEANGRALAKAGAFIRKRARSSLRHRRRPSPPGTPPSVHSRDDRASLKNILFASPPGSESMVVGPVLLNQVNAFRFPHGAGTFAIRGTVPQLMEFGGLASIVEWDLKGDGKWSRANRKFTKTFRRWSDRGVIKQRTRNRVARYDARPFMGPALEKEADNLPNAWSAALSS